MGDLRVGWKDWGTTMVEIVEMWDGLRIVGEARATLRR